jgi:hypothetical protein
MNPRSRHHSRTVLRTVVGLFAVLAFGPSVHAGERDENVRAPLLRLESASEAELLTGLEDLPKHTPRTRPALLAALGGVAKLLSAGHSDPVTDRALATFGTLSAPAPQAAGAAPSIAASELPAGAVSSLLAFTHHRRAVARALAVQALANVAGRDAKLRRDVADGLSDSAPEVRAAAARGLRELRATEATPRLLKAFARGVPEAAVTLGSIGDAASLTAYTEQLTRAPLDVMLSGYERYLLRPDLNDKAKLEVVAKLEDLSGEPVLRFLSGLARQAQPSPALKQALLAASARIAKALPRTAAGGQS